MPRHVYERLKNGEIRVLRLYPGAKDDPLLGHLEHVALGVASFQAISYAWGEPVFNQSIYIDSEELRITDSLSGALRRFRDAEKDVCLWADQLCINQNDLTEKNVQVAIMVKIFGSAHKVHVWLGEPEEHHDVAFSMMHFLGGPWWSTEIWQLARSTALAQVRQGWKEYNADVTLEEGLAAFSTIAKKRWFERLWVVQEVLAAHYYRTSFYCGQHSIISSKAVTAFQRFGEFVRHNFVSGFDSSRETRIASLYESIFFSQPLGAMSSAPRFLEVLFETSHLKASEPRDRVFALMSTGDKNVSGRIKVDYAMDLPQLWRLVARCFLVNDITPIAIASTGAIMLALPATLTEMAESSSSWSTDFGALTAESHRKRTWYIQEGPRYYAGRGLSFLSRETVTDVWKWTGVLLGQIDEVLEGSSIPVSPKNVGSLKDLVEFVCKLLCQYTVCLEFARRVLPSGWISRADSNLLFRQGTSQSGHHRQSGLIKTVFEKVLEQNLVSISSEDNPRDMVIDASDLSVSEAIGYMDHSRLLASAMIGYDVYLGWVPKQARIGDHVCLLQGCPAPFIVRELSDGYYAIVGDAYILGIMNGERWPNVESEIRILEFK